MSTLHRAALVHRAAALPLAGATLGGYPRLGDRLVDWYRPRQRPLPWRERWRELRDPYHVWVSEIMLQQTVIKVVIPVYERFLARFPTLAAMAAASEDELREAVRGLGYYRRFRMMHAAARQVMAQGGVWPRTLSGLRELPGIGEYTAAAIGSIAFDLPEVVVDGNVERVVCRLLDLRVSPAAPGVKRIIKAEAAWLLAKAAPGDSNQALMELGQTVCTVASPRCDECPLADICLARARQTQHLAPSPKVKKAVVDVEMRLAILVSGELYGLIERPTMARFLKGTWGFLTLLRRESGWVIDGGSPVTLPAAAVHGKVRHTITCHRLAASVLAIPLAATPPAALAARVQWLAADDVERRLVANLDRKAWRLYEQTRGSLE